MARTADEALAALVRERGPALVRYATLLTGEPAAAQDLVQDALVKVFVRTRSGFSPDVLEAYVRRAIATLYLDGHRRRVTFGRVRHLVATSDHLAGPEQATAEAVDLRAALAGLGRQERTAVVLRYLDDLPVAEVAEVMGLAQGTVKRYVSNGVRRLEQRLGPLPGLDPDETTHVVVTTTAREG